MSEGFKPFKTMRAAIYDPATGAETEVDSLDAAWAEAEAALPTEDFSDEAIAGGRDTGPWEIASLIHDERGWFARATEVIAGGTLDEMEATGPTPAAALRALAEKLRG